MSIYKGRGLAKKKAVVFSRRIDTLMRTMSGAKLEEKLIFCFKNDKNLVNFDPSTKKSKKFAL